MQICFFPNSSCFIFFISVRRKYSKVYLFYNRQLNHLWAFFARQSRYSSMLSSSSSSSLSSIFVSSFCCSFVRLLICAVSFFFSNSNTLKKFQTSRWNECPRWMKAEREVSENIYRDQFRICSWISSICRSAVASSCSSAMIAFEKSDASFISCWNFSHSNSVGSL